MDILRDESGKFRKGNSGFWLGKKRGSMSGEGNWNWIGGDTTKVCLDCGEKFYARGERRKTGKFCSHSCRARWNFTGSRNPKWDGGKPREMRTELPEYNEWRKMVYRRDGWKCQICDYRGKLLVAHHIRTWKAFPKERFDIENGITLCRGCHCKLHTIHRRVTDFREILNDYTLNSERG